MRKFLLYALTAVLALGASSCKDDEVMGPNKPNEDFDRMPMTMFRLEENTGVSSDPYGMRVITEERNTVELAWYGVSGAGGYEIRYGLQSGLTSGKEEDWADDSRIIEDIVITDPEQLTLRIQNLEYKTQYRFAIRVLHPDYMNDLNSPKHSLWYGHGSGREWAEQAGLETLERYNTPGVINVGNVAEDGSAFTVYMNINVRDAVDSYCVWGSDVTQAVKDKLPADVIEALREPYRVEVFKDFCENFEMVKDGTEGDWKTAKFKVDRLVVKPSADTPSATVNAKWSSYKFQDSDFTDGIAEFRVDGLTQNAIYQVDVFNDNIPVEVDARYNTVRKAVYGQPGDPILIKHVVYKNDPVPGAVKYNASPLDTIIGNFATDINLAEGQTFYLEGGKAYYFFAHPGLCKGFTLETDPADVAQGKRATVYMGGIGNGLDEANQPTAALSTCNMMFGRQKSAGEADAPIEVGSVIFRNTDFDCPESTNFGHQSEGVANATGNYFVNMYSDGMEVVFDSFEIYNCTFQGLIRGFMRVQGPKKKTFNKIVIDGNLFYNCGYYDTNGRGYAWFAGDGASTVSNIYKNFQFTNNTIYDSPRTCLISDNDKNIEYAESVQWNIRVENNTFFNFSTRSTGRNFFQTRYVPGGSYYSFQRNLIVLATADNDARRLYQYGADIREVKGSGIFSFDVKDNYSIGCRPEHMADNKIFNSSQFSNSKNSFGSSTWVPGNLGTPDDLIVKVGSTPLDAKDVFVNAITPYTAHNPAAPNHRDHEAPANILEALKFQSTAAVTAHEIYKNRIGDPRWY